MSAVIDPEESVNLPAVAPTGFPVSYEEARQAIAKCESPLECRTKAQQAAAMVVYARMRDDTDLQNRAVRLQAWANRRYGELDKLLYPDRRQENLKQGSRNAVDHISAELPKNANFADQPQAGKRPAPTDGTTEYQRTVSRRLASIPEDEFTRQVESPTPPSVTQLGDLGKVARPQQEDSSSDDDSEEPERLTPEEEAEAWASFERTYGAAIDKVMGADDKLSAAHAEIKRVS